MKKYINLIIALIFLQVGEGVIINLDKVISVEAKGKHKTEIVYGVEFTSRYVGTRHSIILDEPFEDFKEKLREALDTSRPVIQIVPEGEKDKE